jgi:(p)ppGpp synthase/HD superfamily hydrolase
MTWSSEKYQRALHLAAHWHREQRFSDHGLPYVVHVVAVCAELQRALITEPTQLPDLAVQAALLHDILEDTAMTFDKLCLEVGPEVAAVVAALSKNPLLPKHQQMADSLRRILQQPVEAAKVKLADRVTNLAQPPSYWSREKCAAYRAEAEQILQALGAASPVLAARLQERIASYAVYI